MGEIPSGDFRDIADRISAAEQNAQACWRDGDLEMVDRLGERIRDLQDEASDLGATPDSHPGLFGGIARIFGG